MDRKAHGRQRRWIVYGVSVWKTIRNLWQVFSHRISFQVGDGKKISFREDRWLGNAILQSLFPNIYALNQQQKACIREVWGNHRWYLSYRRPLNDWQRRQICRFPQHHNSIHRNYPDSRQNLVEYPQTWSFPSKSSITTC